MDLPSDIRYILHPLDTLSYGRAASFESIAFIAKLAMKEARWFCI